MPTINTIVGDFTMKYSLRQQQGMSLLPFIIPILVGAFGLQLLFILQSMKQEENFYTSDLIDEHFTQIEKGLRRYYVSTCAIGDIPLSELQDKYLTTPPVFINGETYAASISVISGVAHSTVKLIAVSDLDKMIKDSAIKNGAQIVSNTITRTKPIHRSKTPAQHLKVQQSEFFAYLPCK